MHNGKPAPPQVNIFGKLAVLGVADYGPSELLTKMSYVLVPESPL